MESAHSALVVGASGVVGRAAVQAFAESGSRVVGWSRRAPDVGPGVAEHVDADLRDEEASASAVREIGRVDTVVYGALHETDELISGWQSRGRTDTNLEMLRHLVEPLLASGSSPHVMLLQGTKAYGSHLHDIPTPARESLPRDPHESFYWRQQDYLAELAAEGRLTYTIFRPQLVVGGSVGVATNPIAAIGAWAALCKDAGVPCGFPGGPRFVWESVDARVLAAAFVWAASTPQSTSGEIYNVTNGDVFTWRDLWPALMDALGVELGPDQPTELRSFFADHVDDWRRLAARYALRSPDLLELLGQADQAIDYYFGYGQERPRDKLVSTIKIRTAGFDGFIDTEDSFRYWLHDLQRRGYLPPAD
jgi:nucleoside-diphosphate-sugar epimerase